MSKKNRRYKQSTMKELDEQNQKISPDFENTGEVEFLDEQNDKKSCCENETEDDFVADAGEVDEQAMEFDFYKQQLDAQRANMEMYMRMAQQLQADFDNYRKRNANISKESRRDGINEAVNALLPAYDALVEGLRMIKDENTRKGLEMVERVFVQSLSNLGILPIEALNKQFDPKFHNAILSEEVEGVESGTVVQEFSKGFVWDDGTVVRVATVKTAK